MSEDREYWKVLNQLDRALAEFLIQWGPHWTEYKGAHGCLSYYDFGNWMKNHIQKSDFGFMVTDLEEAYAGDRELNYENMMIPKF